MTQKKLAASPHFLNWWSSLFSNSFCNAFYGCHLEKSCEANLDRVITKLFWPSGTLVLTVSWCLLSAFNLHSVAHKNNPFSIQYFAFLFHLQSFLISCCAGRLYCKWLISQLSLSEMSGWVFSFMPNRTNTTVANTCSHFHTKVLCSTFKNSDAKISELKADTEDESIEKKRLLIFHHFSGWYISFLNALFCFSGFWKVYIQIVPCRFFLPHCIKCLNYL